MISDSAKIITRFGFPGLDGSLLEIDLHDKRRAVFLDTTAKPEPLIIFKQGSGFRRLNHERIPVNAKSALRFHAQPSLLEFYDPKKGVENLLPVTVFLTDSSTGDTYELGTTPTKELCDKEKLPQDPSRLALDAFAWIATANAMVGSHSIPVIYQIHSKATSNSLTYWLYYFCRDMSGIWEFSFADNAVQLSDSDPQNPASLLGKATIQFPGEMFRISAIRVAVASDLTSDKQPKPSSIVGKHFVPVLLILTPTDSSLCNLPVWILGMTLTPSHLNSIPEAIGQTLKGYTYLDCVKRSGDALTWAEEFNRALVDRFPKSRRAEIVKSNIESSIKDGFAQVLEESKKFADKQEHDKSTAANLQHAESK